MNKKLFAIVSAALLATVAYGQNATTRNVNANADVNVWDKTNVGALKALNSNPTEAYGPSRVDTKFNIDIKDNTKAVHFIKDNNDPRVVTKAYEIKNADVYIIRNVLRTIVAGSIEDSPVGVEAINYIDGSKVILVSAEEYRFKDLGNGMSIDSIVASLDKADLPNSIGTFDYAYFPRFNSASSLREKLIESGIGFSNTVQTARTTWFENDKFNSSGLGWIDIDPGLNALVISIPGHDMQEAIDFMRTVDNPRPETYLTFKLIELYAENDQKIGLDFQSWKNNDGINFFSVGGKYGVNNWGAGVIPNNGNRYAEYLNFNPKWNTKYLDFLTTCGKAKVVTSGKMILTTADPDSEDETSDLTLTNGVFTVALEKIQDPSVLENMPEASNEADSKYGKRKREILSDEGLAGLLSSFFVQKGNTQEVEPGENTIFNMKVKADVHANASNINISMSNVSLIGWEGDGTPRLSRSEYSTSVQIGSEAKDFVIGGINKVSVVRSVSGIPLLKDLPVLGWLFSTESDSVKRSQYVLVGTLEPAPVDGTISAEEKETIDAAKAKIEKATALPMATAGFQQLLLDK